MFKFPFESTNYKIDDFINGISLESKYIKQENISYIKKSFKTLKLTVIDKTNCSEYKDDNDALYFFDIELKTTKYIKEVCKLFVQMFTKINPFLIQFKFNNK